MGKPLTPKEAYKRVAKIAKANDMAVSTWAEFRGVYKGTLSKWKNKEGGTVTVAMLEKLGVSI